MHKVQTVCTNSSALSAQGTGSVQVARFLRKGGPIDGLNLNPQTHSFWEIEETYDKVVTKKCCKDRGFTKHCDLEHPSEYIIP